MKFRLVEDLNTGLENKLSIYTTNTGYQDDNQFAYKSFDKFN